MEIAKSAAVTSADGNHKASTLADPIEVFWNDRDTISQLIVLSGETDKVLLGVCPLEEMDLMVDVVHQCLVGAHDDEWMRYVR